ncbi:MAG: hypothetical protein IJT34_00145, partial [Butyrivibrio sp.]|nr:hypothetical protein [Butyrivibrio sp.]
MRWEESGRFLGLARLNVNPTLLFLTISISEQNVFYIILLQLPYPESLFLSDPDPRHQKSQI